MEREQFIKRASSLLPLLAFTIILLLVQRTSARSQQVNPLLPAWEFTKIFYSDATYSTEVGEYDLYCNGHRTMTGTATAYFIITDGDSCSVGGYFPPTPIYCPGGNGLCYEFPGP